MTEDRGAAVAGAALLTAFSSSPVPYAVVKTHEQSRRLAVDQTNCGTL